jgi:hypothetical protein
MAHRCEPALPRKLKVFRTAVGFRDAFVAAPSKAAALRAWGTQKDLFARGAAEEVTDPTLSADALNKPGEVVYRTRGSLEEQVAALGDLPARKAKPTAKQVEAKQTKAKASRDKPPRPPRPRPSRAELEAAEEAIATLRRKHEEADAELHDQERALAAERKAMEARFAQQLEQLQHSQEQARRTYEALLRAWTP